MEKPIVFLSHSSLDRKALSELKNLLDQRAAGSLELFLSSDGQSIRLGKNWVMRISDALAQAKLMFLFLSPRSLDSRWIHFEAGSAYAKGIRVVPVCLPGLDLGQLQPPLSLLQGFNLHGPDSLSNLARICNEDFNLRMKEEFSRQEFDLLFSDWLDSTAVAVSNLRRVIERLRIESVTKLEKAEPFSMLDSLSSLFNDAGVRCLRSRTNPSTEVLETPGWYVIVTRAEIVRKQRPVASIVLAGQTISADTEERSTGDLDVAQQLTMRGTLSARLVETNARILDEWVKLAPLTTPWNVTVEFPEGFSAENARSELTSRLHEVGITMAEGERFDFEGLLFTLHARSLRFTCAGTLSDQRLPRLMQKLLESGLLFYFDEDPLARLPDLS